VSERRATELIVSVRGAQLAVTYTPGDIALIALHGASNGTRDHPLYQHLHAILPRHGFGVATFDRRGEGASTGDPSVGDFELQASDALAVTEAIAAKQIGLWGFSQGAWVAPIAARRSHRVRFLVLIAATGVTPSAQMQYATAEHLRRAGYESRIVEWASQLRRQFEAWVHEPDPADGERLRGALKAAEQEPWWSLAFLPAQLPDAMGRRAWISEMDFDPLPYMRAVADPTLLFYGEDDEWTPVDASVAAWRRARGDAVHVAVIDGASHDLTIADGTLSPTYEQHLVTWLREQRGPGF
jgi:pimeloyl-ACP methyl ester carboxylesterase